LYAYTFDVIVSSIAVGHTLGVVKIFKNPDFHIGFAFESLIFAFLFHLLSFKDVKKYSNTRNGI
jgi:hypothetical protein